MTTVACSVAEADQPAVESDNESDEDNIDIVTISPPPPPAAATAAVALSESTVVAAAAVEGAERPLKRRCLHTPVGPTLRWAKLQRVSEADMGKYGFTEHCLWVWWRAPAADKAAKKNKKQRGLSYSAEPLSYVLTWQEENGPHSDRHWRQTVMGIMAKDTVYVPMGDSSAVDAVTCSASTVKQRFRHHKPYACLAFALFNLVDAPVRYKTKMKSDFGESVDSFPTFFEYLDVLHKRGLDLPTVSQPERKSGTAWLYTATCLGILCYDGHAYGVDCARQLLFDGKSEMARPLTDLTNIGVHASNTHYEWLAVHKKA